MEYVGVPIWDTTLWFTIFFFFGTQKISGELKRFWGGGVLVSLNNLATPVDRFSSYSF